MPRALPGLFSVFKPDGAGKQPRRMPGLFFDLRLLIPRPVGVLRQLRPVLVRIRAGVFVAVRRLLHREVIPRGRRVVAPHPHPRQQVAVLHRVAFQHAVYHRHRLRARYLRIRAEGAVLVARYPAQRRRSLDALARPVPGNIREIALELRLRLVKPREKCCKFSPRYRRVGVENALRPARDDAKLHQRGHCHVVPVAFVHVRKAVGGRQVAVEHLRLQQAEN